MTPNQANYLIRFRTYLIRLFSWMLIFAGAAPVGAQTTPISNPFVDSLQRNLQRAKDDNAKLYALKDLADYYTGTNPELSEDYARQGQQLADLSRDRSLMVKAYLWNGNLHLSMAETAGKIKAALSDFEHAEKLARDNNLSSELGFALIGLARGWRVSGDYAKALNYNHEALAEANTGNDDSLKVFANLSLGVTYKTRNEKLLAFRSFLEALDVAELSKNQTLIRNVYSYIGDIYSSMGDYEKAIDYYVKMIALEDKSNPYPLLDDYNHLGRLFVKNKQFDLALAMYEKSIHLADSLHFPKSKIQSYLNIANMYFNSDQLQKGMRYMNSHEELLSYFKTSGQQVFLDQGYGAVYTELGMYDSAAYFFKKAEPVIETMTDSYFGRYEFYREYADFFSKNKQYDQAIAFYLRARKIGQQVNDIELLQNSDKELDTMYMRKGDYKTASVYNSEYNLYKDSLRALAKESDILKLAVDNDNRRRERLAREDEEATRRRHNIQYVGATIGIISLFIVLVMLGLFRISPRIIRALGFFSFIFLFEFIILLADDQIHEMTHGEPWKVLVIKIFLAAVLLPLHHWLEHKVIHYLSTRRKISTEGWLSFKKKEVAAEETSLG